MVLEILAVVLKDRIPDFLSAPNFYFKAIPRSKKNEKRNKSSIKNIHLSSMEHFKTSTNNLGDQPKPFFFLFASFLQIMLLLTEKPMDDI